MRRNRFVTAGAALGAVAAAARNTQYLYKGAKRLYNSRSRGNAKSKRTAYGPNGVHKEKFVKTLALTTTAGGVLEDRFNLLNPTRITNGSGTVEDWAEVSALYEMYRVTGWKIHLVPSLNVNDTSKVVKYITYGVDPNDPDTTAASNQLDLLVRGGKLFNTHRPLNLSRKVRMPMTAQNALGDAIQSYKAGWCPVSDLAVNGPTLKIYGGGLTASTIYFAGYVEMFVEFKNRVHQA